MVENMNPRTSWLAAAVVGCLLAAAVAVAEPPKMSITGPTQVIPGSAVFLQCETDSTALEWLVFPQSAVGNFVPLTVYKGMTPDGKPILGYVAFFSSPTPGAYTFAAVGCKDNQLGKAIHTLINGKVDPDPDPDPEPDPDPNPIPPPGERFVLVVAESAQRSPAQAELLMALQAYCSAKKHPCRFEDPDLKDRNGKTPEWLASYLQHLSKARIALPALVVSAQSDGASEAKILTIVALPSTAAAAIQIVKDHGG